MKTFREIVEAVMSYEDWVLKYAELDKLVNDADKKLKDAAGKHPGGLVPDEVSSSKEFKDASNMFNKTNSAFKAFIKASDKKYMKRQSQEYRANRGR